jgi:hypothetical protein
MFINSELIPGAGSCSIPTNYNYIDGSNFLPEDIYWYWLESINETGESEFYGPVVLTIPYGDHGTPLIPQVYGLRSNHPNPFNPSTSINFIVQENQRVNLFIYNTKGQKIRELLKDIYVDGDKNYNIIWDGKDRLNKPQSSGIYYYRLIADGEDQTRKMLMLK